MNLFLQVFLYVDVFVIGMLVSLGLRHAYAHFHHHDEVEQKAPPRQQKELPPSVKEKLLEQSSEKFQHIIDHSAKQLEQELAQTGEKINTTVKKLAADIITKELEGFQAMFQEYQKRAVLELEESKSSTDKYRTELKTQVEEDIEKEKQQRLDIIDQRLSDAVVSFVLEALGHDVDLGSQTPYLISQLEAHKDELKKAVSDEA